jgi:hypothetical protein
MAKLFISYSHRDAKPLDRLHKHLATLSRQDLVETWFDRNITAGQKIDREIERALAEADVFLALVSPDFLASDYCSERELGEALRRHDEGSLRVIPVILEPCDWQATRLGELKALPKDGQPISLWTNANVAYLDVITELRRILTDIQLPASALLKNAAAEAPAAISPTVPKRQYRVKREFDSIDRDEFREKAFAGIREYFRRSIDELNQIGDPIRARFEDMGGTGFSCTVLNKAARNREAHITVHSSAEKHRSGEISYVFERRAAPGTSNGHISVVADEYALSLKMDTYAFHRSGEGRSSVSAEEAADHLWREFIEQAGIEDA